MTTRNEKISAIFIGFFTCIGTALAIVLLLFVVMSATLDNGKVAPWLQHSASGIITAAPIVGTCVGVLVAWRYLHTRQAKRQRQSGTPSSAPETPQK